MYLVDLVSLSKRSGMGGFPVGSRGHSEGAFTCDFIRVRSLCSEVSSGGIGGRTLQSDLANRLPMVTICATGIAEIELVIVYRDCRAQEKDR